ncbi:hypothetical protein BU23DRAFT_425604, partial [Bimuria novae-zelandiae CBS 107.79]
FWVHEKFICQKSAFFRAALNGYWKESEAKVVKLPEDNPEDFNTYLALMHTDVVHHAHCNEDDTQTMSEDLHRLCSLYLLADKLQDYKSMNAIIEVLVSDLNQSRVIPATYTVYMVYRGSPTSSPPWKLPV